MLTLEPLGARILVRRDIAPEQTEGGIVVPVNAREKPRTGTIISLGPTATGFSVGDRIVFPLYAGTEVEHAKETLLLMHIDDVFARILETPD